MAYHYTFTVSAIILVLTYYAHLKILRYRHVSAFSRQHGCVQPRASADSGLIGLRLILAFRAGHKARKLLEGGTLVMTIEPENIKTILANKFDDFGLGKRLEVFSPLLTGGIFVNDGEPWKHSRALVRPAFSRNQVADLESFEPHTPKLIARIPKDGSTIDLGPLFFRLTLDQASEFLLGESVNSQNGEEDSPAARFGTAFDYAVSRLDDVGASRILSYLWPDRRFFRDCRTVHNFVEDLVQKARERHALRVQKEKDSPAKEKPESGRYVFLDELVKVTDNPREMIDELLSVLVAGRDTTAGMLTSAFNILSKRPDIWAKLRAEAEVLGGEPPDYETLRNMKYLKYFLNEMLRLYPAVPGNAREATKDTYLPLGGGPNGKSPVFIAKGQIVAYTVYAMHRLNPIYGEDAYEFRPERWESLRVGWEYLPFNGGPRICVGQQFALAEFGYTVVRLVQTFKELESRDPEPWMEKLSLTATSANGAKVALRH